MQRNVAVVKIFTNLTAETSSHLGPVGSGRGA